MKQILVMMVVVVLVGCGEKAVIADRVVEDSVRIFLKKPEGKLTEEDLKKVTRLNLSHTIITDVGLKEAVKLQSLEALWLDNNKITDAGLEEVTKLQKLALTCPAPKSPMQASRKWPSCKTL